MKFSTILRSIKPFLGGVTVSVNRNRQQIHFTRGGSTEILTVDQLFDEIENIFSNAKPAGPARVPVRQEPIRADNTWENGPSWLTICNNPKSNVLGD